MVFSDRMLSHKSQMNGQKVTCKRTKSFNTCGFTAEKPSNFTHSLCFIHKLLLDLGRDLR